jgi:hypothetical protein
MADKLNLNITDAEVNELTGPELKAHITAIQGTPQNKIATRSEGIRKLQRLRQWARNVDGMSGIPKDTEPQVKTYAELFAKCKARGAIMQPLPTPADRLTPIDPEYDDPEDIVDGDEAISANIAAKAQDTPVARPGVAEDADTAADSRGTLQAPDQAEATPPAVEPTPAPAPWFVKVAAGVEVESEGEKIMHKRGTLRARLAEQAANAAPIQAAPSAMKDRRPKKETGAPRKERESLIAVKATFAGTSKLHVNNETRRMRYETLQFIQSKALRDIPGWPKGAVLVEELKKFNGKDVRPFVHKLIEEGHVTRVQPIIPE